MKFVASDGTVNNILAGKSGVDAFDRRDQSRRQFLAGLAAIGAAACSPSGEPAADAAAAQVPITDRRRIDVHHHYAPPGWIKVLADNNALSTSYRGWHYSQAVEAMDRAGVATSIGSITAPGIYFWEGFGNQRGDPAARVKNDVRALAREANEFGAKMKADYPGRFGIWASLPLPDVDGSLREIEYAYDTLKLDGIGLMTSIGNRWLGDPAFSPVFDELNRRKAVVYTHPQVAPCCLRLIPGVGQTTIEYSTDTARTIVSWIESGSAKRFPDVTFIFSHGGGTLWSARYIGEEIGTSRKAFESPEKPPEKLSYLRKFYYDTAASLNFIQMQTLKTLVGASQIVFGADYPHGDPIDYVPGLEKLAEEGVFTAEELRLIDRENMLKVLPRYST